MENKLRDMKMSKPFAYEAEEAVICSLLLDQDYWPEITLALTAEMFETPALAFIYGAMKGLYERGEQPDLVTIEMEMRKQNPKYFVEINGLSAINQGMRRIRQSLNVMVYANEVKRCYLLRRLRALFTISLSRAGLDESVPEEIITGTEKGLLELRRYLENAPSLRLLGKVASETLAYHEGRLEGKEDLKQVKTGFTEFDALTGGMHNGELYVLGGRPGDGKSSVALQVAMNAALQGKEVCFFSLEMTDLQIMNRLFAGHASVRPEHLRASGLTREEMERMRKLTDDWQKLPFYLDYTPANRIENIRSQVMLQKKKKGCDLVIVDYLHLLEGATENRENLVHLIGRHIKALKALALEADCAVLVLSQMNRSSELRKEKGSVPILSDLRDSGTIEQVADCVFFVYRPDRHGVDKQKGTGQCLRNSLLLMIIKNRNGQIGTARVVHNGSFTRVSNPDGNLSF